MKTKTLAGTLVLGLLLNAQASLIWTIEQVGNDVVISTAGGTLDLTGLTKSTHGFNEGAYSSFYAGWARVNTLDPSGSATIELDYYSDDQWTFSKNWTSYFEAVADSATGENYWFQDNMLCIPLDYESGSQLGAASMTFENTSLENMTLNEGESASWTWGADSMTVEVVPEPATAGLLGISVGALWLFRRAKNHYRT